MSMFLERSGGEPVETCSIPRLSNLASDDDSDVLSETEESESDITESDDVRLSDEDENWSTAHFRKTVEFTGKPGLKLELSGEERPVDFFNLFFGYDFLNALASDMNRKGKGWRKLRSSPWKNVDEKELRTFVALLFHSGTEYALKNFWSANPLYNLSFREFMDKKRFFAILKAFRFGRNADQCGRLNRITPLLEYFNKTMERLYYPRKILLLGEPHVVFKDNVVKKSNFDRKQKGEAFRFLHSLVDASNGIVVRFAVPTRKGCDGHVHNIVLNMMSGMLNCGHTLYVDEFYNCVALAHKLLDLNTHCTGYVGPHGKGVPRKLLDAKVRPKEFKMYHSKGLTLVKDSGNNFLLTSEHGRELKDRKNLKALVKLADSLFEFDLQAKLGRHRPNTKRTGWYTNVLVHVFQMMFHNSYLLYKHCTNSGMSRENFRSQVLDDLLELSSTRASGIKHVTSESESEDDIISSIMMGI